MNITFTTAEEAEKFWRKRRRERLKLLSRIGLTIWTTFCFAGFWWMLTRIPGPVVLKIYGWLELIIATSICLYLIIVGIFAGQSLYRLYSEEK